MPAAGAAATPVLPALALPVAAAEGPFQVLLADPAAGAAPDFIAA